MRIVTLAVATCAFVVLNSNPAVAQADPDAKGTVTCAASVPAGTATIEVTGNKTAVNGWNTGKVTALAMLKTGGRIYTAESAVKVANWTISLTNMPNGEYQVWAQLEVTRVVGGQTELQLVGSALTTATVNLPNNPNPAETTGGTISFGTNQPVRNNGGATITASGTFAVSMSYVRTSNGDTSIAVVTIPANGGVVRQGFPTSIDDGQGTWSGVVCNVPSTLTINVFCTLPVRPKPTNPNGTAHVVGSPWVSK